MSTAAILLILVILIGVAAVVSLIVCWRQTREIDDLKAAHGKLRARDAADFARPVNGRSLGDQPRQRPAFRPSSAMSTGELAALDEKVDAYLPSSARLSPSRADLLPVRVTADGHPPWTGEIPVIDENEMMRQEYIASYLRDAREVTPEVMREAMDGLYNLPVYGEAPVADVLEGERLAQVMQP